MSNELLRWQEIKKSKKPQNKVKEEIPGSGLAWRNLSNLSDYELLFWWLQQVEETRYVFIINFPSKKKKKGDLKHKQGTREHKNDVIDSNQSHTEPHVRDHLSRFYSLKT